MKIAVLTSRFPLPLDKGDKLRAFYHIVELAKYHEVHLIALSDVDIPDHLIQKMDEHCASVECIRLNQSASIARIAKGVFSDMPLQVAYFYNKNIKAEIDSYLEAISPDHLYVQLIRMAPYVMDLPYPKSIDYMDSIVLNMKAMGMPQLSHIPFMNQIEKTRITNYEKKVFSSFQNHFIISERDKSHFSPEVREDLIVAPNGVNLDFFEPDPSIPKEYEVVFVGNLSYLHNEKAGHFIIDDIMPRMRTDVNVLIAGAEPSKWLNIKQQHNVRVEGWTDDVRMHYQRAKVFIAPIFTGSGQQNKVLEAMAQGIPVVTSSFVNESIGAAPDDDVLIANTPREYIAAIETILADDGLALQLSIRGRQFVQYHYQWSDTIAPILDAIES